MFENIVAAILSKYLGDYVEGLESENFSLSIYSGNVVLTDLKLKKHCLSQLELPIVVKEGYLGKLTLAIPWKSIGKTPIIIGIEDVYLIAGPTQPADYDAEYVLHKQQENKRKRLQLAELVNDENNESNPELDSQSEDDDDSPKKTSYTSRLVQSAMDKFQVNLSNIHVRYEDDISQRGSKFAVGITLERFTAESVDRSKIAKSFLQQLTANLKNLSMYWDFNAKFLQYNSIAQMQQKMVKMIWKDSSENSLPSYSHVLQPINGKLELQFNKKSTPDLNIPKIVTAAIFQKIAVSFHELQYKQLLSLADYFTYYIRGIRYHQYRPSALIRPKENPMRWWKFALQGMRDDAHKKRSIWKWSRIQTFKADRILYIQLWKKKQQLKKKCPEDILSQLDSLESAHSYDDIIVFRQLAIASLSVIPSSHPAEHERKQPGGGGWFSWVWSSGPKVEEDQEEIVKDFTFSQWKQLYKAIKFLPDPDSKEEKKDTPREYIHTNASLSLESGSIDLIGSLGDMSIHKSIIQAGFNGFDVKIYKRPESLTVWGDIASIAVNDFYTLAEEQGIIEMISLNPSSRQQNEQFLSIRFDQNPLDRDVDISVVVLAKQSLNITCSRNILDRIALYFAQGGTSQLKLAANSTWDSLKENAKLEVKHAFDNRKKIDVFMDVVAPNLIVPSSFTQEDAPIIIIELGRITMRSDVESKKRAIQNDLGELTVSEEYYYDRFDFSLSNIRAAVSSRNVNFLEQSSEEIDLLTNFDINTTLCVCTVSSNDLPQFKLASKLPALRMSVSPDKLQKLFTVLRAFSSSDEKVQDHKSLQAQQEKDKENAQQEKENKSSDKKDSDKDGKYKLVHQDLSQKQQLGINIEFGEVSLVMQEDHRDILVTAMKELRLSVLKSAHYTDVRLILNAFFIEDRVQAWGEEFKYLLTTMADSSDDLMTVSYRNVPKTSPAFQIVEHEVSVNINNIDIMINRGTLAEIMKFTSLCTAAMVDPAKRPQELPQPDPVNQGAQNELNSPSDSNGQAAIKQDKQLESTTILFKVESNLSRMSVTLIKSQKKFLYSSLQNSTINAEVYSNNELRVNGSIGNIAVQDLTENTLWRDIIRIDGDRIVDFWFETINPTPDDDTGKIIVTVQMSTVAFVYSTRFIRGAASYLNEFSQMQELVASTAKKAAEKAQSSAKSITKVVIVDVRIANPCIIVPRGSMEKDHVIANLGDIAVNNKIEKVGASGLMDSILISITSISMRTSQELLHQTARPVIRETNVQLSLTRPITPEAKNTLPDLTLAVNLSEITLEISEAQVELFLGIFSGNLTEVPTKSSDLAAVQHRLGAEVKEAERALAKVPEPSKQEGVVPGRVKTRISLELNRISLEIFEGSGLSAHNESSSFAMFSMEGFASELCIGQDDSLQSSLTLRNIHIADRRLTSNSFFKDIFSRTKDKNMLTPLLQVVYIKARDGSQNAQVALTAPRVVVVPDVIWEFKVFSMRVLDTINSTLAKMKTSVVHEEPKESPDKDQSSSPMEHKELDLQSKPASVGASLFAEVKITDPRVYLVENPTDQASRAIVMKNSILVSFETGPEGMNSSVGLSDIQIYKCRLNSEAATLIRILEPYSVHVDYVTRTKESMSIQVEISRVNLTLSYSDVKLMLSIKDSWMKVFSPPTPVADESHKDEKLALAPPEALNTDDSSKDVQKKSEEAVPLNQSTPDLTKGSPTLQEMIQQRLRLTFAGFSVQLLNDCYGESTDKALVTPLMLIIVEEISTTLAEWSSSSFQGSVSLVGLKMFYYNSILNLPEPMIESWSFITELERPKELQVKLGAVDPLLINVTKSFVETTMIALEQWQADLYQTPQALGRQASYPYYIRNDTGMALTYWITGTTRKHKVDSGAELPLDLMELEAERRASMLGSDKELCHMISIELEDFDIVTIHNLIFSKSVSYLFTDISSRDTTLRLFYKVLFRDGSKILTIGSDIVIVNETVVPVQIQLESKMLAPFYMEPLPPGGRTSIPIRYATKCALRIRPKGFAYEWSRESIQCSTTMRETIPNMFVCASKDEKTKQSPGWVFIVSKKGVRAKNPGMSTSDDQEVLFTIRPPLSLENTLPTRLSYVIKDPSGMNLTSGTLAIGAKAEIYQVLPDHRPVLLLQVGDYGWSDPKKLGASKKASVTLINKQRQAIRFGLQTELSTTGARTTTVYSNYWLINRTGNKLYYRQPKLLLKPSDSEEFRIHGESTIINSTSKDYERPQSSIFKQSPLEILPAPVGSPGEGVQMIPEPVGEIHVVPFMYSEQAVSVKSSLSTWSRPIYLQQNGGVVELIHEADKSPKPKQVVQLGVAVKSAPGKFWRTSVVEITPYYLFINNTGVPLEYKQFQTEEAKLLEIEDQIQFSWQNFQLGHFLQVRFEDGLWSTPFFIDAANSFQIPLFRTEQQKLAELVRIKISASNSSVGVVFWKSEKDTPDYMVDNQSSMSLLVGQARTSETIVVEPASKLPYAWHSPLAEKKKLHLSVAHTVVDKIINVDKLQEYPPVVWQKSDGERHSLSLEVLADGPTKILVVKDLLTDEELQEASNRASFSRIDLSAQDVVEQKRNQQAEEESQLKIGLDFSSITLSLIDEKPSELVFITISSLQLLACMNGSSQSLELSIAQLQIDNQLYSTPFPILLYSRPVENQCFFQMSLLKSNQYPHLKYLPYFAVKFQEMDIKIDEICLLRILNFLEVITNFAASRKLEENEMKLFCYSPSFRLSDVELQMTGTMVYFDILHINPIRLNLSFETTGGNTDLEKNSILVKSLRAGGFLANIDGAPLRLNGLILKNPMCSQQELISRISQHYTRQALTGVYKILGSADILGSPVSLVSNLGTGVYDFFHEPAEGIVNSPRDFAAGVARGTSSLFKNSVFGVFNSASKISGSISKAATTISLDEEWKRERARKMRSKPQHVSAGFSRGVKSLGLGVFHGVTGVFSQPLKGFSEEGRVGLVKGVGKGVSGLVLKPVVGVVDFITDTTEGIKNTANNSQDKRERIRPPRYFGLDRVVRPFDAVPSEFQLFIRTLEDGRYERHTYLYHIQLLPDAFVLFSDLSMFFFSTKAGGIPKKKWVCKYSAIQKVDLVAEGLEFNVANKKIMMEIPKHLSTAVKDAVVKQIRAKLPSAEQMKYHMVEDPEMIRKYQGEENLPMIVRPARERNVPLEKEPNQKQNAGEKTPLISTTNPSIQVKSNRKLPPPEEDGCCSCCALM